MDVVDPWDDTIKTSLVRYADSSANLKVLLFTS
jgi:hypothetical protein